MVELMDRYEGNPTGLKRCIDDIRVPQPLAHEFERPDKQEIVQSFIARFN
jgi:hypothetical protein